MNLLPKAIEDIIVIFKEQLEHKEHTLKFQKTLDEIDNISYRSNDRESWRTYGSKSVNCYGGLNHANLMRESIHELWIHTFTDVETEGETEVTKIIFEDIRYIEIINN